MHFILLLSCLACQLSGFFSAGLSARYPSIGKMVSTVDGRDMLRMDIGFFIGTLEPLFGIPGILAYSEEDGWFRKGSQQARNIKKHLGPSKADRCQSPWTGNC